MMQYPKHLVWFFNGEILSLYRDQSARYDVETDNFSGRLQTSSNHYTGNAAATGKNLIDVRFGFRTMVDGEMALAVWMPDLQKASQDEQIKWLGFGIDDHRFVDDVDARFEMWIERYINGSWSVENGVVARIKDVVEGINALTLRTVEHALFKFENLSTVRFPSAQNNHRYYDAHSGVYRILIDGLNLPAIQALALKFDVTLQRSDKYTVKHLENILPTSIHKQVFDPLYKVSRYRGLADHGEQPKAERMLAFEQFNTDLEEIETGLRLVQAELAKRLTVSVDSCRARRAAMSMTPEFDPDRTVPPNEALAIEGKRIDRVEYGFRKRINGVHDSELIVLYFSDGSSISIDTGSNVGNLCNSGAKLNPNDLSIRFDLDFVPPLKSLEADDSDA